MKYVSVCAGIEAATVAWHPLGWVPVLFSEIDGPARSVLHHHYPTVPLVGDFTELIATPPAADLLVGGTPCQAFSVAGKRLSLEDYRGNLTLAFTALAAAGQYPWVLWENVPGVLSTKDNAFGCLLAGLVGEHSPLEPPGGRWTNAGVVSGPAGVAAWRVLDAQWHGVAQRRRRVFVFFGRGPRGWAAAAALLPVESGVSRHPPARSQSREGTAPDAAGSPGDSGAFGWDRAQVTSPTNRGQPTPGLTGTLHAGGGEVAISDATGAITARFGGAAMAVPQPDCSPAVTAKWAKGSGGPAGDEAGNLTVEPLAVRTANTGANGHGVARDVAHTPDSAQGQAVVAAWRVRRLTPRECERLQGFPDDYTLTPNAKGKPMADGPRYKMLGNSMAVPVMRWIGQRLDDVLREEGLTHAP